MPKRKPDNWTFNSAGIGPLWGEAASEFETGELCRSRCQWSTSPATPPAQAAFLCPPLLAFCALRARRANAHLPPSPDSALARLVRTSRFCLQQLPFSLVVGMDREARGFRHAVTGNGARCRRRSHGEPGAAPGRQSMTDRA
jgi:hypothetical protein